MRASVSKVLCNPILPLYLCATTEQLRCVLRTNSERGSQDRHQEAKPKIDDHLGGTWFEGMAEEVLKRPAAVDFSKMSGRPAPMEQQLEDEVLQEVVGPVEGQTDLEVKEWHPNKPKPAAAYVMPDVKKHPRFPKEKAPEPFDPSAPLEPLPNYDYLKGKEPVLVNMGRMRGRVDEDADMEEAILREVEGERIDFEGRGVGRVLSIGTVAVHNLQLVYTGAQEVAAERDRAVRRGNTALSGNKRTPLAVDMSKQVGRHDSQLGGDTEQLMADLNNERAARLVENPELTAPILRHPKDIGRGEGGGVRDWSKLPGRASSDADAVAEALGSDMTPREQLILDPVRDATSKYVVSLPLVVFNALPLIWVHYLPTDTSGCRAAWLGRKATRTPASPTTPGSE
jgi:hypothetical protein